MSATRIWQCYAMVNNNLRQQAICVGKVKIAEYSSAILGGIIQTPAVEVLVRGYGAGLGQPADDFANLRKELHTVFPDTHIKVGKWVPLRDTGLRGAVYTVVLEGVPDGGDGYVGQPGPPQAVAAAGEAVQEAGV